MSQSKPQPQPQPLHFIHTADWHIGNPFGRFDRQMRKELNQAILDALNLMFLYAHKHEIPLLLCAGDVVDNGQMCSKDELFGLFKIINQYPHITVVIIAGNHDPLVSRNIYERVDPANYPKNLRLVAGDETLSFPQWNLELHAASLKEKNGTYNPLAWLADKTLHNERFNVGLCHGSIKNDVFADNNFPIEPDTAQRFRLDYLALGDWHSFTKINDRTYYPGVPEPLQMGDNGYALHVTIPAPGALPKVEQVPVAQYRWLEEEKTVSADNYNEFKAQLESVGDKEIRKWAVSGFLPMDTYKSYKELIHLNRSRYMEIVDRVSLRPDDQQLMDAAHGFMSGLVGRLIALKESEEPLPHEIVNGLATANQSNVRQLADQLDKAQIIDNALLMIYEHCKLNEDR